MPQWLCFNESIFFIFCPSNQFIKCSTFYFEMIRRKCFPKTIGDIGAFAFLLVMIPVTYLFVLLVTLPSVYEVGSVWYVIHVFGITFMLINVLGSFFAVIVIDTSIKTVFIPSNLLPNWRYCSVCESVVPPRSWHCNICNACILKRDHHCIFTGYCIGHYNHRFFIMFLVYMCFGTVYATRFNSCFMWKLLDFTSPAIIFKMIFPFAVLVFGIDASEKQCFMLISLINIAGLLFCGSLLYYHLRCLFKGSVTYEMNHNITDYDHGMKRNITCVFGKRWGVSWICPFIPSELPHDGIHWEKKLNENKKNR